MLYPMLSVLVFGNRYGYGDPEFLRLLNLFSDNFRIMSSRWGEVPGTRQRARLLCPQQQQDPESHFQEETLVMMMHLFFFGDTETTSTTLCYGFLILLKYPEVAGLQARDPEWEAAAWGWLEGPGSAQLTAYPSPSQGAGAGPCGRAETRPKPGRPRATALHQRSAAPDPALHQHGAPGAAVHPPP
uniref:cytochrome P450 2F2-like n=1 Tax=Macaca mulatta TaxID=9544 RepID=UPI0010A26CDD|nr:cytochrome P450 2F2-like [Macaca mulatta]